MRISSCSYIACRAQLLSTDEIVAGFCGEHLSQLKSDKHYVGICWSCGTITLIAESPEYLSEKYIFTKTCVRCFGKTIQDNGQWITFGKSEIPTLFYMDINGKLLKFVYPIKENLARQNDGTAI